MFDRAAFRVPKQILLADIGDIGGFFILSEKVVIWLLTLWPSFLGDRIIPFFAICKDWVDVENHSAKIKYPVAYDIADAETGIRVTRHVNRAAGRS